MLGSFLFTGIPKVRTLFGTSPKRDTWHEVWEGPE